MADQNIDIKRSKDGAIQPVTSTTQKPLQDGSRSPTTPTSAAGNLHRSSYEEGLEHTFWARTARSFDKSPWFPIGLASFVGVAAYAGGSYYKNRKVFRLDPMARTLFWTKFRIYAQGAAVGIIMLGFLDDLYLRYGKSTIVPPPAEASAGWREKK